ncbi:MAG: potassium channel family protein [Nanobdellota archaeon]
MKKPKHFTEQFYSKKLMKWIDKLTFPRIFLLWALIILLFGLSYNIFITDTSYLMNSNGSIITKVSDSIYFSFIAATTTGFGDIVPVGNFKPIVIIEVVLGFMLLAIVTSRLVSIKQNVILNEVYDIALRDNVNRLRLSLALFMQKVSQEILEIQEGKVSQKKIQEINLNLIQFEKLIKDINELTHKEDDGILDKKTFNILDHELLVFNILNSIERLADMFKIIKRKKFKKKFNNSKNILKKTIPKIEKILESFENIDEEIDFKNYETRKENALQRIKKELNISEKN